MRAIAEGLFTEEAPPRLIGGRERVSGRIVFPCPLGDAFEPFPLARDGVLWSWTVQRFRPKTPPYAGPDAFAPWIVAYVELPGQVIVETRLVDWCRCRSIRRLPIPCSSLLLPPRNT
jgi:uncharacterized OB-fold protein